MQRQADSGWSLWEGLWVVAVSPEARSPDHHVTVGCNVLLEVPATLG